MTIGPPVNLRNLGFVNLYRLLYTLPVAHMSHCLFVRWLSMFCCRTLAFIHRSGAGNRLGVSVPVRAATSWMPCSRHAGSSARCALIVASAAATPPAAAAAAAVSPRRHSAWRKFPGKVSSCLTRRSRSEEETWRTLRRTSCTRRNTPRAGALRARNARRTSPKTR